MVRYDIEGGGTGLADTGGAASLVWPRDEIQDGWVCCGVALRTKHFDIVAVVSQGWIASMREAVVSLEVICASALLALSSFLNSGSYSLATFITAIRNSTSPLVVFFPGNLRTVGDSATLTGAIFCGCPISPFGLKWRMANLTNKIVDYLYLIVFAPLTGALSGAERLVCSQLRKPFAKDISANPAYEGDLGNARFHNIFVHENNMGCHWPCLKGVA